MPKAGAPPITSPLPAEMTPSRTVLVTGGSRGIGRAICLEFGRAGWRVGVHYRERRKEADFTVAAIEAQGGRADFYQADLREAGQVRAMIDDLVAHSGPLDIMVCNAGVASSRLLLRLSPDEWLNVLHTNLTGTFHCLQAAGAHMLARRQGSVVVIGSFAGLQGGPGQSAYAASKAGLFGLVKSTAREWGDHNIRINVVLPGRHTTALTTPARHTVPRHDNHVLGRAPGLDAVARSIYHLALLEDVSGQVWNLDSRLL